MNEKNHYTSVEIMQTVNEVKKIQLETFELMKNELLTMMKAIRGGHAADGEWMDRVDTMQMLRISRQTLYRYTKTGDLTGHKMGGKVFYSRKEVDALLRKAG